MTQTCKIFFQSNKKAAVLEQIMAHTLFVPGVIEAAFSAFQKQTSKTLVGLEKRRWFAVSNLSTVTPQQSKTNGRTELQGYLAKH